ncbi:protein-disulfide reductase DsbD [Pseudomonas sp. SIMBA_077]
MHRLFVFFFLILTGFSQAHASNDPFAPKADFLPAAKAFVFSSEPLPSGETRLSWKIADKYYLYQKRFKFDGLDAAHTPVMPQGEEHNDEFFGASQVYRQYVEMLIPAGASGKVNVSWQGCADAGLCYPPQSQTIDLGGAAPVAAQGQAQDQSLAASLQQRSLGWSLLLFFGLGLLLAFTPCSLPMLPILAGLVVGSGTSVRRGFAVASSYVLSMALVYAALGVLAAMLGANLQALLQQPWLLGSFAALFVVLALPMFGFFELQLPAALRDRLENAGRGRKGGSLLGAGILGALSGLLVGPCMTAPLAGALLYIAQSGNAVEGGLVLFVMGVGIGMPLLLLVTLGSRFLPKPGAWMDLTKGLFGFLFLATALLLMRPVVSEALWLGLWGVLLIIFASSVWQQARNFARARPFFSPLSILAGLWGGLMLVGAAGGGTDVWQPLQVYTAKTVAGSTVSSDHGDFITLNDPASLDRELASAKSEGQWVLLDYYADWCVSCKVMEKQVFAKPQVQAALQGVRLLRLDVTADNEASRELLKRYQVPGPPSFIWIGPNGVERRGQRITGEVNAQTFLNNWNVARELP